MNHHKSPFITNETQRYPDLGRRQPRFFPAILRGFCARAAKKAAIHAMFYASAKFKNFRALFAAGRFAARQRN
jgi:hypothetical protein